MWAKKFTFQSFYTQGDGKMLSQGKAYNNERVYTMTRATTAEKVKKDGHYSLKMTVL